MGPQLHVMSLPRSDGNCEAGFDSAGKPNMLRYWVRVRQANVTFNHTSRVCGYVP